MHLIVPKYKHQSLLSLLLNLLSHFVFVYYLLEISKSFRCVIEHILLLYALAYYLVKNDLETYGDATTV